ncbi:MAG: pilin [Candidatus Saccharibacteria bacterium]|nr:pilin [Candidatus Saccharibacteria bacterium]
MKRIRTFITSAVASLAVVAALLSPVLVPSTAEAQIQKGINAARTDDMSSAVEPESIVQKVVNIILFVLGVLAVIMIIVGGFRYVTSGGDSNKLTSAKNTILYAVIGLIVALFAYAIVNWVVKQVQ